MEEQDGEGAGCAARGDGSEVGGGEAQGREGGGGEEGREANDDRRGVIEAIRLQANAAKAKEEKMQQIEADTQGGTLPVGPPPMSDEERAAAQPQSTSLLGETEQGGIFGIGHLKTFWKSRRPKQSDDDESSR